MAVAKTKEEVLTEIKKLGTELTAFELSPQAEQIIKSFDSFPYLHFKAWFKKHYGDVNGVHLHHYFSVSDGINEANK